MAVALAVAAPLLCSGALSRADVLFRMSAGPGGSGVHIDGTRGLAPLRKIAVITNQGREPLSGARVFYTGDTYITKQAFDVATVQPGETASVEFLLDADHYVHIKDVPAAMPFKLVDKSGGPLGTFSGSFDMSWLRGSLEAPQFDPKPFDLPAFNVLLFGQAGSGKTSFYNSVQRMLQSQTDGFAGVNVEPVLGGQEHVTLNLKRLASAHSSLPLALWDTYGLAHNTWQGNELEMLMNGKLPAGWHKDTDIRLATTDEVAEFENRPHAVLIFVTAGEVADFDGEFMQNLKRQVVNIVRQGINPLLLVTKLDNGENKCLQENWLCAPAYKEQVRSAAAAAFGLPIGNVYPNINYMDFDRKNIEFDRNLYTIIHRALTQAKHTLEQEQTKLATAAATPGVPLVQQRRLAAEAEARSQRAKAAQWRSSSERHEASFEGCKQDLADAKKELAASTEAKSKLDADKLKLLEKIETLTATKEEQAQLASANKKVTAAETDAAVARKAATEAEQALADEKRRAEDKASSARSSSTAWLCVYVLAMVLSRVLCTSNEARTLLGNDIETAYKLFKLAIRIPAAPAERAEADAPTQPESTAEAPAQPSNESDAPAHPTSLPTSPDTSVIIATGSELAAEIEETMRLESEVRRNAQAMAQAEE